MSHASLTQSTGVPYTRIHAVGAARGDVIVPNDDIVGPIESSDEWIRQRTGVITRTRASANVQAVDLAEAASREAIEKAGAADREAVTEQLKTAEFGSGVMPYGTTKFGEDGQNVNALPLNTQVQDGKINVIYPDA